MARREADPLLLPEEVAEQLRVRVRLLEHWRYLDRGRPPGAPPHGPDYVKVGNLVRYPQRAVDAYIERNTVQNSPAA